MSIIKILYTTAILFACSVIQVFGVLIEGAAKLLSKFGEYLEIAHDKLVGKVERKKTIKKKTQIDIPL